MTNGYHASEPRRGGDAAVTRLNEFWQLLPAWVAQNSFTGNIAGCDAMADALDAAFALPGLTASTRAGHGAGRHVAYKTPAFLQGKRDVVLIGHHDTVFPPGTFVDYRADDQFAYGPGVLDMKGGLLVIRTALAILADRGELASRGIAVVSVSDEETGSADGRDWLLATAAGCQQALVFESGRAGDALVVARKGTGKVTVTANGKAAHAGNDLALGINAIWALAKFIDQAQMLTKPDGSVTVNTGLVVGGTSANTVPANASCELDLRVVRVADGEALLAELAAIAAQVSKSTGAAVTLSGGLRRQPWQMTPASEALAQRYGKVAHACGLGAALAPLVGGGSDANTVAEIGIPAIDGLGPRGKGFHTHNEFIEKASVSPKVQALVEFLAAL